ncbi:hypothetical protein CUJ83_08280 [Methanocella sp. CWC-04]|uniref:Uncharacterized protein n=1 Tax=Methanooceanicella nereidis TaxID=2052831 RepID=A0AAP2RCQ1_9EURY|nr:hypothetical protein [Methanocella sp. CWC-04]MCD1294993.1 hypothetical protein [Methanocella sp. CWC-04]
MTVEDVLKRRMLHILSKETPYVLEEARFGMFDLAVYIPEDTIFEGIEESKKISAVRACNKYQLDGICSEKKRDFLKKFEPLYDDHLLLMGFKDNGSGVVLSEKEFNELINDKKQTYSHMACGVNEDGEGCEYLDHRLGWEQGFLAGYGLKQGLHLFEFKSDHDNVNRFMEQLPHYSLFADYIWLVVGSEQKIPKWLPSYVGIYREEGEGFVKIKESQFIKRRPPFSRAVLRECGIPDGAIDDSMLYDFIRKWFINSIFFRSNGVVMQMNELDHLLSGYEKNKKKGARQSTLKF